MIVQSQVCEDRFSIPCFWYSWGCWYDGWCIL